MASAASAASTAAPERGRSIKALILGRISHPFIY
jgi:hypothetical protein